MTERYRSVEDLGKAGFALGEPKRSFGLTPEQGAKLLESDGMDVSALVGGREVMEIKCGDGASLNETATKLLTRLKILALFR